MKRAKELILDRPDVTSDQIIYINFESLTFSDLAADYKVFYQYLIEKANPNKKNYFFFDEIQLAQAW